MWKPSKSKYHAKKVTFDGITFDSKKEGLYYLKLKDMETERRDTEPPPPSPV